MSDKPLRGIADTPVPGTNFTFAQLLLGLLNDMKENIVNAEKAEAEMRGLPFQEKDTFEVFVSIESIENVAKGIGSSFRLRIVEPSAETDNKPCVAIQIKTKAEERSRIIAPNGSGKLILPN